MPSVDELIREFGVDGVSDLLALDLLTDDEAREFAARHLPTPTSEELVRDRFPRPTGQELFAAKTREEQDEMLGPEAAEKVRNGLPLADLVAVSPLDSDAQNFITQAPDKAL